MSTSVEILHPIDGRRAGINADGNLVLQKPSGTTAIIAEGAGSMLDRARHRYAVKAAATLPLLNIIGDSWADGQGATGSNGFAQQLITEFAAVTNASGYGYAGEPIAGYSSAPRLSGSGASNASKIQILPNSITVGILGLNDCKGGQVGGTLGGCGTNPINFAAMRSKVHAMATHFLTPESSKVRMQNIAQTAVNPALTLGGGGTWILGYNLNTGCIYNATTPVSITLTTAVGNLIIFRFMQATGAGTAWTLTIDGVSYPNLDCDCPFGNWSQTAIIVRVPTVAAHTVVLTSTAGYAMMESVDCVDASKDFGATLIYSTPLYIIDATGKGWDLSLTANSAVEAGVTGALAWMYADGGCERFSLMLDNAMRELYELGFNVVPAQCLSGWRKDAMLATDGLHPNDYGHAFLKTKFSAYMRSLLSL
jgi:hypothetical protein